MMNALKVFSDEIDSQNRLQYVFTLDSRLFNTNDTWDKEDA
jgi:hypothetical protein